MDLHTWITQQVDATEAEGRAMLLDPIPILRRCEADRRILARHRIDPGQAGSVTYAAACEGCGIDDWGLPDIDNLNDCPELLDLAHAHGLTEETLAGLDRPQPGEPCTRMQAAPAQTGIRGLAHVLGVKPITTSQVPAALRGPRWKP
ncbi:hypothetical protein [Streptomyces sp. enrichment culture]|uniref:hypothetical protein n=1 Tax=Streptomyces sp. enrichment culture TaxID=1795815 RepID=UPI003F56BC53